ncbi:MAG: isoprenyl transferase [Candidatus Omnitrophica bacterium]|nr:isoprenyl transferase [Candidatus Omnitrophota bacterium]
MIDKNNIPKHVAIIMDGNGRWAKEKGLGRTAGHREGVRRVKEIISAAKALGIQVMTLFAFSAENWNRPASEINMLMRYLDDFLEREVNNLHKDNIRFLAIGEDEPLPKNIQKKIKDAQRKTQGNTAMTLVLALNYGARQEITEAAKRFASAVAAGQLRIDDLDADKFATYFYTAGLPDPDLLIRTSGAMRISNFLLWQLSYAELYFPGKYWPDFKSEDLEEAIQEYQRRERRFGGVKEGN